MRKIIVSELMTLDGVMGDPGGTEGTPRGGWSIPYYNEEYGKFKSDEVLNAGAVLLGRITYEEFAKAWPSRVDDTGVAERMNTMPKYVVSDRDISADWQNSTVISDDIINKVAELKEQPGDDILVLGSGQLVRALLEAELVDELRLLVHPVVVGEGKRLFTETSSIQKYTLTDLTQIAGGSVISTYRPEKRGGVK